MAGPSIGTWVKVKNKSGRMTSRVIPNKFGGGGYSQGEVITQSEFQKVQKKRADMADAKEASRDPIAYADKSLRMARQARKDIEANAAKANKMAEDILKKYPLIPDNPNAEKKWKQTVAKEEAKLRKLQDKYGIPNNNVRGSKALQMRRKPKSMVRSAKGLRRRGFNRDAENDN